MKDAQNIFYTSISKYYSDIFPYNPIQLSYVKNKVGDLSGKTILDIGCATGELSYQLAKNGATMVGIDLNNDLLARAKKNKIHPKLTFRQGNMLELHKDFKAEQFDTVLCFGNTLVHLENEQQVLQMLGSTKVVLKSGGLLLLQILNYDHIVDEQVSALPIIETENIKFIRKYKFQKDFNRIRFITDLEIKAEAKTVSNDTALLALKSKELMILLEKAGFMNFQLYANFKQDVFGGKHLPLVLCCNK